MWQAQFVPMLYRIILCELPDFLHSLPLSAAV